MGEPRKPKADAVPEAAGMMISLMPSFPATVAACNGPAPPIATIA